MTNTERILLRPLIKRVAQFNTDVWWELKQQIFDNGLQAYYPAQDAFLKPARSALDSLAPELKESLIAEWVTRQSQEHLSWDHILEEYAHSVVAEVVRRAIIAANRTDW